MPGNGGRVLRGCTYRKKRKKGRPKNMRGFEGVHKASPRGVKRNCGRESDEKIVAAPED